MLYDAHSTPPSLSPLRKGELSGMAPTMRKKMAMCAGVIVPVLALSGCYDAKAGISISGDDLVNGNITITPKGGSAGELRNWQVPSEFASRMTKETVDQNTGEVKILFSNLAFDETTAALRDISNDSLKVEIARTSANTLSVNGTADLRATPDATVMLAVTFPEPVTKSNGEMNAESTIQWRIGGGEKDIIWAQAPAGSTMRNTFLTWTIIASAVGVLAALLVVLWARRTRDMQDF